MAVTNTGPSAGPASVPSPRAEAAETVALRGLVSAYGRLSSMATDHTDLSAVIRLLAGTVGGGVAVLGPTLVVQAVAGVVGPPDVVERLRSYAGTRGLGPVLAAVDRSRRALTLPGVAGHGSPVVIAPITTGDDLVAYLVAFPPAGDGVAGDTQLLLAEHAAMICGVVLGRERVVAAAAGRARLDLVEGVLHGRERADGELARWASHLGFVEGREHHVLAARARPDGPEPAGAGVSAAHATIEACLIHRAPEAVVALREDEVVAIVPGPQGAVFGRVRGLAVECRATVERRHPGFVTEIGIGGPCAHSGEIAVSYGQARRSLDTIRRTRRGGVVAFHELGVQRLLLPVPDVAGLRAFAHEVFAGAIDQDAGTGAEHLRTLSAYFRENCSPRRAAAGLHVHPNTVSYRIRRIEELTGLSLDRYQDRLLAQIAVEILVPSGEP